MAAPTSNNEVTARRLSRLLVGADGNGGLWKKVNDKVSGAIAALDVSSVGGAGKYISAISETDGKISATATSMDTAPTASSTNAVTSGGVKTALDGKASTALDNVTAKSLGNLYATNYGITNHSAIATGYGLLVTIDTTNLSGYSDIHAVFELYDNRSNTNYTGHRHLVVNIRNNSGTSGAGSYTYKIEQTIHEPVWSALTLKAYRTGDNDVRIYSVGAGSTVYGGMICKLISCTDCNGTSRYSKLTFTQTTATSTVPSGTEVPISIITDTPLSSIKKNGSTITLDSGVADLGYMPVAEMGTTGTVQEIIQSLRVKPGGRIGSVITRECTISSITFPRSTWWNYIWIPHCSGSNTGDEQRYGTLILTPLNSTPDMYIIEGSALDGSSPAYRAKRLAYSDHSHGNLTNGGALQTTDVTIANGDKLVVTDASDSNKVARASIAFDGSTAGTLLSKKGTFENPLEGYLEWGGKNRSSSYGPVDAAMIDVLGANRFSFGKPAGITIEYTRDGGTTWIDYGASDAGKIELVTNTSGASSFTIGKADSTNKATAPENWANYKLRVIFTSPAFGLYTEIRKIALLVSTNGTDGAKVTARAISRTNEESGGSWTALGSMTLGGWSGWNIFNFSSVYNPWSGNSGQKSQHSKIEFLFEATQASTTDHQNYNGLNIVRILGYAWKPAWSSPSTMASTGHLYSFDNAQNATFPAQVTATSFKGLLKREFDSSAAFDSTDIVQVTSGSDAFRIRYARNSTGVNTTTFASYQNSNDVLSFGNVVGSEYKQAINITNGSAAITGSLTGTASTAKAYDTSFTGTNSIKSALDGKQNTLTVMTDTEVSDLLAAMT